jgi:small subunit ribosomal protein S16
MSVVIRMKRSGRKNRPFFRISVADIRAPRDGRTIESLGLYDPIAPRADMQLTLDVERARYWLSKGAQASETVTSIFKRSGVLEPGAPQPPKRERPGRGKPTRTRERREAIQSARATAKASRRAARRQAAASARKAANAQGEAAPPS